MRPLARLALVILAAAFSHAARSQSSSPFTIVRQSGGWSAEYSYVPIGRSPIPIGSRQYLVFAEKTVWTPSQAGKPLLPVESFSLAVPPGATVRAELVEPSYEESAGVDVAPAGETLKEDATPSSQEYIPDPRAYGSDAFTPEREVWTDSPVTFRQVRMATVHVAVIRYHPVRHLLRTLLHATIRVTLENLPPGTPLMREMSAGDPLAIPFERSLVSNPGQIREWSATVLKKGSVAVDAARDWFTPGHQYIRVPVAADGWYRLDPQALINAGGVDALSDPASVVMYRKGRKVPILFRQDSAIEFFGERNRGDTTFIDYHTDTSAYWLAWGESNVARFEEASVVGSVVDSILAAPRSLHVESNTDYYEGTGDSEITKNSTVPGEGWVWDYYYPGTSITYSFPVDNIDPGADSAEVRVRLFGTTIDQTSPAHRAWFWVNDSAAGQVTFPIRKAGLFRAKVPARWLVSGSNRLRVLSDPPAFGVNQFYLDWFEVDYPRMLAAVNDTISFTVVPTKGAGAYGVRAGGFSAGSIDVYDLTDGRKVTGGSVTDDGSGHFSISFADTVSTARQYAIRTTAASAPITPVQAKTFSDLRSTGLGADYVVITHKAFLSEAQQLAAHRAAFNGVRSVVIDVQDVYDQFNFGDLNAERIRDFLKYAYQNWQAPAPLYLVMFGDASWDFHRYKANAVNQNFVPGYGVPVGDNWFTCFDPASPSVAWMFTGRIPVQTPSDAQHVLAKLLSYDAYQPDAWCKRYLFITGGATIQEQSTFNTLSNTSISSLILPAPLGGEPLRVYKASADPINGDYTDIIRSYVQTGVVFLNFLGHSGGRYWSVDIGKPSQLGNTNGRFPFVSSVSCNVGAFAEPATTTLSEDFLLAENQGAIGVWASSSLGYPYIGTRLLNSFLGTMRTDTARSFGELTTKARIQVLLGALSDYAVVASTNLNPLIGDPLSRMAVPTKPELAITDGDLSLLNPVPSVLDTQFTLRATVRNFGLVPPDSVQVSVEDAFAGKTIPLVTGAKLAPVFVKDSLIVRWKGGGEIGLHTFTAAADPLQLIPEGDRTNNRISVDAYVYANLLAVIEPLNSTAVPPGIVRLRVSSPIGVDSSSMQVEFQVDTTLTFSSPAMIGSGPVNPGAASAAWHTPSLASGKVYYWRARAYTPTVSGAWVQSSFSTSQSLPSPPLLRWTQSTPSQLATGGLNRTAPTDSGLTITASPTTQLYARSAGYNASMERDFYSILKVGGQTYFAYWWNQGTGFIGGRMNAFTGEATFRSFDLPSKAAQADSMTAFINSTPAGHYMMFSVIFDGRTNVTAALRTALKSLGSSFIDSVWPGHTWCMIARKGSSGPGMAPLEHWDKSAVVADSMVVQNIYSLGSGSVSSLVLPMPQALKNFSWQTGATAGETDIQAVVYGYHDDGRRDSLAGIPWTTPQSDLSFLQGTIVDSTLVRLGFVATLSSQDALVSPVLKGWSADFEPPADLAVTQRALSAPKMRLAKGQSGSVTLNVYNVGYRTSHNPRLVLSMVGQGNALVPLAMAGIDSIPAESFRTLQVPFNTDGLPSSFTVQASVIPRSDEKELIWENNSALYGFTKGPDAVTGSDYGVAFYSDGIRLIDGDYVAARPVINVHLGNAAEVAAHPPSVDLFVDGVLVGPPSLTLDKFAGHTLGEPGTDFSFRPTMNNGSHTLRVRLLRYLAGAELDSVHVRLDVNVVRESRILQLLNYPNPFTTETWFTFILTGSRPPESGTIRIYTIAGRKIRELPMGAGDLQIGFNRIRWDGRDEEGDDVANGYYLYSLSTSSDGSAIRSLGKMVRVR